MNLLRYLPHAAPLLRASHFPVLAAALLVLLSSYHFLLFHTAAEFLSIGVAWAMLAVMWHSYEYARNHLLMFLSLGFFWLGGIDLVHALAYSGMGVFPDDGGNLSSQLWIAARLLEALLLLMAPALIRSPVRRVPLFLAMGLLAILVVVAALAGALPDTFIAGKGLTPFKVRTEYFIIALLALAAIHFHRRREELDPGLFGAILLLLAFTAISELAFTFYVSVYGLSNLVGHIFKIFAFWVLYTAIVNYPLRQVSTAAREQREIAERLRASEAALRESNRFVTLALDSQLDTFFVFEPATGRAIRWNRAFRLATGYTDEEIAALKAPDGYYSPEDLRKLNTAVGSAGPQGSVNIELTLLGKGGRRTPSEYSAAFITDAAGVARFVITVGRDITDRSRTQEKEREQLDELRRWQAVMLDREERMVALKSEVNSLLARLGEPPRYSGIQAPAGPQPTRCEEPQP